MFADDFPLTYEKHFGRPFDIKDYCVCYLEDMLAELPDSIICRKEIEGRTTQMATNSMQASAINNSIHHPLLNKLTCI